MWKPTPPPFKDFKKEVFEKAKKVADFIYQIGETPLLRIPSKPVDLEQIHSEDQQAKFKYLKDSLIRYRKLTGYGRGITAVQVGIRERFSVIYTPERLILVVNPRVTKISDDLLNYPEMCMSANPIIAPTVRPSWVEFEYYNELGEKHEWDTKDDTDTGRMMNRVFLHELDHMDGIINIDKVENAGGLIIESDPEFYTHASFEKVR